MSASNQPETDYLSLGQRAVDDTGAAHEKAISLLVNAPRQKGDPPCQIAAILKTDRRRLVVPTRIPPDGLRHAFVATGPSATPKFHLAKGSAIKDQMPGIQLVFLLSVGLPTGVEERLVDLLPAAGIDEATIDQAVTLLAAAVLELRTSTAPVIDAAKLSWVEVATTGEKIERVWVCAGSVMTVMPVVGTPPTAPVVGAAACIGYPNIAYCLAQDVRFTEAATKFVQYLTWLSGIVMGTPAYAAALASVVAQKSKEPPQKKQKMAALVVADRSPQDTLAAARQRCVFLEKEIAETAAAEKAELVLQVEDGKEKETKSRTRRTAYRKEIRELQAQIKELEAQIQQESPAIHEAAIAKLKAKHAEKVRQLVESLRGANQQIATGVTAAELQADIVAQQQATTNERIAAFEAEISRLRDENQHTKALLETSNATIASQQAQLQQMAPPAQAISAVVIPFPAASSQAVCPSPMNYDFLNSGTASNMGTPWNF